MVEAFYDYSNRTCQKHLHNLNRCLPTKRQYTSKHGSRFDWTSDCLLSEYWCCFKCVHLSQWKKSTWVNSWVGGKVKRFSSFMLSLSFKRKKRTFIRYEKYQSHSKIYFQKLNFFFLTPLTKWRVASKLIFFYYFGFQHWNPQTKYYKIGVNQVI